MKGYVRVSDSSHCIQLFSHDFTKAMKIMILCIMMVMGMDGDHEDDDGDSEMTKVMMMMMMTLLGYVRAPS